MAPPLHAKVLLVIGDAAEVLDTFYPYFRLPESGYEVVVAGPARKRYHLVLHERPEGWDLTRETAGYHLDSDIAFAEIDAGEYAGILLSGGRAPEYIRYDPHLIETVQAMDRAGKPIASVCHGVEIIARARVIEGKKLTTVPKCRFDAEVCGATFVDEPVVVDGNLVTARTWHDNTPFLYEFIRLLDGAQGSRGSDRRT
jgi:protease I